MSTQPEMQVESPARLPIRVLVIDNNVSHAQAMAETLQRVGYDCTVATSGPEGARYIDQQTFEVIITDLVMNEIDGEEILRRAKETLPECEVILVTGHGTVPKAVEAMQQGAFNFLEKPLNTTRLRAVTEKAAQAVQLKLANVDLQQRLDEKFGFEGIIYASSKMQAVIDRVKRLAPTDATVLITGETGTGKELIAQAIHQNSPRKKKPFVALNCAALSEHLLESELFGHVKGAYTDAAADRVGRFEYAHGGTLFLDEVGDMPMPTQIKLLRVLESGEIVRVGENKPIQVNVRILSATNRDLSKAIEDGRFARICITGCAWSPSTFLGWPIAARTSFPWQTISAKCSRKNIANRCGACRERSAAGYSLMTGRAMSDSCAILWRAWWSSTPTAFWTPTTCRWS
jgi:two-component system, NtrC family, response regulator HydG